MSRTGLIGWGALGLALLAAIAAELGGNPSTPPETVAGSAAGALRPAATPLAADHADRWVLTSLQRPLFSPRRRPPAAASEPTVAGGPGLPRLAGTLVSAAGRQAIFAGEAGARSLVVGEGGQVGAWTVQSIAAGAVAVSGPDGTRTIRPTFDRNAPAPAATPVAANNGDAVPAQAGLLISRRRPPARPSK